MIQYALLKLVFKELLSTKVWFLQRFLTLPQTLKVTSTTSTHPNNLKCGNFEILILIMNIYQFQCTDNSVSDDSDTFLRRRKSKYVTSLLTRSDQTKFHFLLNGISFRHINSFVSTQNNHWYFLAPYRASAVQSDTTQSFLFAFLPIGIRFQMLFLSQIVT